MRAFAVSWVVCCGVESWRDAETWARNGQEVGQRQRQFGHLTVTLVIALALGILARVYRTFQLSYKTHAQARFAVLPLRYCQWLLLLLLLAFGLICKQVSGACLVRLRPSPWTWTSLFTPILFWFITSNCCPFCSLHSHTHMYVCKYWLGGNIESACSAA